MQSMENKYTSPEEDDIDSHDKYIDIKVVLDNNTNGGGNIATLKILVSDINCRPIVIDSNNLLTDSQ